MSRPARLTAIGIAIALSLAIIAVATSAFTPREKETIKVLRQRIIALETLTAAQAQSIVDLQGAVDGLTVDIGTLGENQLILSNDIDIIDAGLSGLVAEDGPIASIDRNLLMTQEYVFARVPAVAITDIEPIVTCDDTTCTVDIEWASEPPATGQVEWGPDETYGNLTTKEEGLLGYHKQRIGTFPADGATYHFRVLAELPDADPVVSASVELVVE